MQAMMKNFMGDMWKNVGDISAMNLMKDMEPTKIGLQMIDYQKNVFNNAYNAMLLIQGQTDKIVEPLFKNIPGIPQDWSNIFKKNQENVKKAFDESFAKSESYLSAAGSPAKKGKPAPAEPPKAKAEPKAK